MESMQQCVVFTSVSASFTLREQGSEHQKKAFSLQGTKGNGATWCGHISSPEPVIKYTFYKEISWHPSSFPFQHEGTSLLPITTKGGQGGRRITFFYPKNSSLLGAILVWASSVLLLWWTEIPRTMDAPWNLRPYSSTLHKTASSPCWHVNSAEDILDHKWAEKPQKSPPQSWCLGRQHQCRWWNAHKWSLSGECAED